MSLGLSHPRVSANGWRVRRVHRKLSVGTLNSSLACLPRGGVRRLSLFSNTMISCSVIHIFMAFQCACDILEWAGPAIKASLESGPFEGYRVHCAGHSFGGAVAACLAGLLDGAIDVEGVETRRNGRHGPKADGGGGNASRGKVKNSRDRRKHEVGTNEKFSPDDGENGWGGEDDAVHTEGAAPWVGICADRVTCVTLGCPPCLSPNLRMPFVTSFVLGDDMVPRTSRESLRRLKRRLLQASYSPPCIGLFCSACSTIIYFVEVICWEIWRECEIFCAPQPPARTALLDFLYPIWK